MNLKPLVQYNVFASNNHQASIIHEREYKNWRETGLAFDFEGSEKHSIPNTSLTSTTLGKIGGKSVQQRRFWGDIQVGPYLAFGLQCDKAEMLKKTNDQHDMLCGHVCNFNVKALMTSYHSRSAPVTVSLLTGSLHQHLQKSSFSMCFDSVFVGYMHAQLIDGMLASSMKKDATLFAEHGTFLISLSKEQKASFSKAIIDKCNAINLVCPQQQQPIVSYLQFKSK